MSEDFRFEGLISKKELLKKYDISYGALYRWKRKGLIPDDWFIKKATITGQETFFPEKLICERMEHILGKKDSLSLDELSDELNGKEDCGTLVLDTEYGSKSFRISEVKRIYLMDADGQSLDITSTIKSIFEEETK